MRRISKHFMVIAMLALFLPLIAACADDGDNGDSTDDSTPTVEVTEDEATEEATENEVTEEATEDEATEEATEAEVTEEATEDEATEEATEDATEETSDEAAGGIGEGETLQIGWIPWDEGVSVTYLWKSLLEEEGFEVELTQLDAGPLYQGVASGDLDLYLDAWLPVTHANYWEQFGDDIEDLGMWYEPAVLAFAVPDYVEDVQSIEDLSDNAEMFDSTIVGIEPGAGMMGLAQEEVMPGYGLDDWTLTESSTPAMLSEFDRAYQNEEPIVVTLWQPHWAYAEYEIRNLEDPENLWGEPDETRVIARDGFSEEYPEVAEWLSNFEMDDDSLGTLMNYVTVEAEDGEEQEAAEQWLEEGDNRELVDSWMSE